MQGIVIIGFPKCGTTSLLEYLKKKYKKEVAGQGGFYPYDFVNKISRREWCYLPFDEQLKRFEHDFGNPVDFKIVFITRDPIDRIWSGWEAWNHYYKDYTYEEYLQLDAKTYSGGLKYLGEVNPIKQVDYWKWIMPWMERYGSEVVNVYSLEGLIVDPNFPQTNSLKKSDIPEDYYKTTKSLLKK